MIVLAVSCSNFSGQSMLRVLHMLLPVQVARLSSVLAAKMSTNLAHARSGACSNLPAAKKSSNIEHRIVTARKTAGMCYTLTIASNARLTALGE